MLITANGADASAFAVDPLVVALPVDVVVTAALPGVAPAVDTEVDAKKLVASPASAADAQTSAAEVAPACRMAEVLISLVFRDLSAPAALPPPKDAVSKESPKTTLLAKRRGDATQVGDFMVG